MLARWPVSSGLEVSLTTLQNANCNAVPWRGVNFTQGGEVDTSLIVGVVTPADFEAAYADHYPWLVRRLALIVGDAEEANDLAQQTFMKAAQRWPFPPEVDVAKWLAVVGVRSAISEWRRRRRWGFLPIRTEDATWALAVDVDVWEALSSLDRRTRAALVLTVLEGYTQSEVASAFGVARGTVASWISRARRLMQPALEERD
jgi:RNA polymerase sigma factor (sigma-70 family)